MNSETPQFKVGDLARIRPEAPEIDRSLTLPSWPKGGLDPLVGQTVTIEKIRHDEGDVPRAFALQEDGTHGWFPLDCLEPVQEG